VRVGILSTSLPSDRTGGAEEQAYRLSEQLASRRHDVTLFTRSKLPSVEIAPGRPRLCQRSRVSLRGVRFGADVAGTMATIARHRKSLDALIAFQTVIDGFLGVLARIRFGIPVMVSVRSEKEYLLDRNPLSRLLSPFVFRHADTIAVQLPAIRKELLQALCDSGHRKLAERISDRIVVIPNGVSIPGEPASGRADSVVYVGRLVEDKGVRTLVEAMRECPREKLVIVGDGPERGRLERAAEGMGNVIFAGRIAPEELDEYYRSAKLLVLPSLRNEGMPNAILGAMVRGIPVVASRNAGTPDLVKDGETGFLVEPGDSSGLARAIRRLSEDPELRSRLGRNALAQMKRYEWPKIVDAVESELRRLTHPGVSSRNENGGRS
jgi:glycosyltransferase involved in cell wall biosynthesis